MEWCVLALVPKTAQAEVFSISLSAKDFDNGDLRFSTLSAAFCRALLCLPAALTGSKAMSVSASYPPSSTFHDRQKHCLGV